MQMVKSQLESQIKTFPTSSGVYLMKGLGDEIIYIGKAKSLRSRVISYFKNKEPSIRLQFLVSRINKIEYILTENEVEAFLLEASLIKNHKPRYNIRLKDDKAYPYICCLLKEDFPRFYFERKVKDKDSLYFGPYTQGQSVREIMTFLNQTFQLRDCSNSDFKTRKRPCLTHQIGFCTAPCVQEVDKKEYRKQFQRALQFLKGKRVGLTKELETKMKKHSREESYEEAGRARDRLKAIEMIEQSQVVVSNEDKDRDIAFLVGNDKESLVEILHLRKGKVIGSRYQFLPYKKEDEILISFLNQYYLDNLIPDEICVGSLLNKTSFKLLQESFSKRKGDACSVFYIPEDDPLAQRVKSNAENHFKDSVLKANKENDILLEIQNKFRLGMLPRRIEAYDISHWQGKESFGSQVVFENGSPKKEDYRIYKLKAVQDINDYASLQEVLTRRMKHKEYPLPDLILIDGGKGQLRAAKKVLKDAGKNSLPLISIAKDRVERNPSASQVSSSGERFYVPGRKNPVVFPSSSEALKMLLYLRDESHRFAIGFHRKTRDKDFLKSKKR